MAGGVVMISFNSKAGALAALLAVLVAAHGARGELDYNNGTARRELMYQMGGGWQDAQATWYGRENGAGPDNNGGGCGFSNTNRYPFNSMTTCGDKNGFADGLGCGSCYQIRCTSRDNPACSGVPKTVIVTDVNYDTSLGPRRFDLSGTAFGSLAKPGQNQKLRNAGRLSIQFRRVPCSYRGLKVTFHVEGGCNPFYFAVLVYYAGSDGTVVRMELREAGSQTWQNMYEEWGAVWRLDPGHPLRAPLSLRVHSDSGMVLEAIDVIPKNWRGDADYRTIAQFRKPYY